MAHVQTQELGDLPTPRPVTAALQKYRQQIRDAAGGSLACVALYGGVVRHRYQARSDINLLLVLTEVDSQALGRLAPVLHSAWREIRLEPLLLAQNELARAAVVFPTKMLDIRRYHRVLEGQDVLSGLEIRPQDISLRVEQELRNLGLRLRRRFLAIQQDELALQRALLEAAVPLRVSFLALLELAKASSGGEERTSAVYAEAAKRFKLDGATLDALARLRDTGTSPGPVRELYLALMQVVGQAADGVNEAGRTA